jgi:hypothetical protein
MVASQKHQFRGSVQGIQVRPNNTADIIVEGRVASLAEIAAREGRVERHIRLLAPLAFVHRE